ncbi:YDG domain-containing protein, partial [Acinetobacter baumannii]
VTLQDVELDGADAGNYVLGVPVTATATIDQRTLTASGIKGVDKVYDGTTSATLDNSASLLSGVLSGDSVGLVASGAFDDKNAGTGK